MTPHSRRISVAVIAAVLLAINIVAIRWSSGFFRSAHKSALLRYGSVIPTLKGKSLLGKNTVEPATNRTNLVLYFSSTKAPGLSLELIKYAEIVSRQYGTQGLGVAAIVQENVPELRTLIDHSLIHYDVIVDTDRAIGEKLGLAPDENGTFIFDQQGKCRFSTRRPVSAGDLRQLVAMEFLHIDPFASSGAGQADIEKGKPLGSLSLVDVRSWQQTSLDKIRSGTPKLFIFFTADCSVCSLPAYLEEFARFESRQQADSNPAQTTVLVFDFNFSSDDLIQQLKTDKINAPAYIANEELSAVADLVRTGALNDEPVVSVETDAAGTVLNISSLRSLIAKGSDSATTAKPQAAQLNTTSPLYEQVFTDIPLSAYDVAGYDGRYLLTDVKNNRVLVVKGNMEIDREFGRIGSSPGRLLHPGYIDVARDGTIYVNDGGNERIVKFSVAGNYLGEFPLGEFEGLAAGPDNELFVGQPREDHLITVYSSSGKKLRSFGELKKYSEIYGAAFADKDALYKTALNQVRLACDKDGNLFVSFMLIPLMQKYSPDGRLVFERKLEAPEIDRLMQEIQKRKYITANRDGADGRIIALDPVIEPATGNILVPLVDGSIYVADRDGHRLALLRPQMPPQANQIFYPFVAGSGAKGELLLTPFPPKRWYRLVITPSSFAKN